MDPFAFARERLCVCVCADAFLGPPKRDTFDACVCFEEALLFVESVSGFPC